MSFEINGTEPSSIIVKKVDKITKQEISSTELSSLVCNGREVWNSKIWVASSTNGLFFSTKGREWSASNLTTGDFSGGARPASGYKTWVACSSTDGMYYSNNGRNWTKCKLAGTYEDITGDFSGGARFSVEMGIWIAVSPTGLYLSMDGFVWTEANIRNAPVGTYFYTAKYIQHVWIATSNNGIFVPAQGNMLDWNHPGSYSSLSVSNVHFGAGICVANDATNYTGLRYTNNIDFFAWKYCKNWVGDEIRSGNFGSAKYADDIWVCPQLNNGGLWYSLDGINWEQTSITTGNFDGGVSYANGIWIACSSTEGMWYSLDGIDWEQIVLATDNFSGGARYADGIWIACSSTDGLWYSLDGIDWEQTSLTTGNFSGGAFNKTMTTEEIMNTMD